MSTNRTRQVDLEDLELTLVELDFTNLSLEPDEDLDVDHVDTHAHDGLIQDSEESLHVYQG